MPEPTRRPSDAFTAWQATLGYISTHHSPDAVLELQVYPSDTGEVQWGAAVSWGVHLERVRGADSIGRALDRLWAEVVRFHEIFLEPADAVRSPAGYTDYLDVNTQDILHRLIWTANRAFVQDWSMVIVYQPTEMPEMRVQIRLLAMQRTLQIGGRGPSLIDAARKTFRNAAPAFVKDVMTDSDYESNQ
ncbi:MAG: hypothetical protein OHK0046_05860 [Anaerolineae bacterium]